MFLQKDTVYDLPVHRVDYFNGRKNYIVEYEGREYRVRMYPHQPIERETLPCVYVGESMGGAPLFEQSYVDMLAEVYDEGEVYSFRICQECIDNNTGAFYYKLLDDYGFYHRVYTQKSPVYHTGDTVKAIVLEITNSYMSLEMLPSESANVSFSLGDVVDLKSEVIPNDLDFSKLNPGRDTTLRDYQVENKRKVYEAWQHCRSVMLQMPTGTGKTRLFVSIARDIFDYSLTIKRTLRVLILAHRKELIQQISDHLGQKYRLAHGLIISQSIEQSKYSMQVGSVPTLNRRLARWENKKFDVIIIDEAHHVKAKSYKRIIDLYPNAKILGVTATPYRLNHAGFRPEFDELIVSPSVNEFIKRGYLCEYDYYSIRPNSNLQQEIDKMKLDFEGDYRESEMMDVMDRDFIRADILDAYLKYARNKKGIVYTISRTHNVHLAEKFKEAGLISAAIDSETPKEKRDELVNKFRRGEIQVLFNVNIFSEGFDCPDVEVIQLARPTKSLSMYLQQVGRGLRPAEGKERLIILDNVGLFNKFGFPSARRKWQYHFEGQEVDESPAAHSLDRDEEREVQYFFEGKEAVSLVHSSTEEDVIPSELDRIVRNYRDNFISYALKSIDPGTVQGYVRTIEGKLDEYIKTYIDPDFKSVFNTVDVEALDTLRTKLSMRRDFVRLNEEKHHVFSASLNKYIQFAKWFFEHQTDPPTLPDIVSTEDGTQSPYKYIEQFKAYLRNDRFSPAGVAHMVDDIRNTIDHNIKNLIDERHESLFNTVDVKEISNFYVKLMSNLSFISLNRMKGNRMSSALKKYLDFAKDYNGLSEPVVEEVKKESLEIYKYQAEFEKYLENRYIKAPAIRRYSSIIKDDIDPIITKVIDSSIKSVYSVNDEDIIRNLYEKLLKDEAFISMNKLRANGADVVMRKYLLFIETNYPKAGEKSVTENDTEETSNAPKLLPDPAQSAPSTSENIAPVDSTKDKEIQKLDELIQLFKKANLPVDPKVENKRRSLLAKQSLQKEIDSIIMFIEDSIARSGINQQLTFKYIADRQDIEVYRPQFSPNLNQEQEDINQIVTKMHQMDLSVPDYVVSRQIEILDLIDLRNKLTRFENLILGYMKYRGPENLKVEFIRRYPDSTYTFKFVGMDAISTKEKRKPEPFKTVFEVDKTPAPSVKGKQLLQVQVGNNKKIRRETATDTFVEAIEEIGIDNVKGTGYSLYGRPIIASKPHPNYKTQCKRLSNGEYLMTLMTTEKKMQLINSFAKHYGLPIVATIVGSKE